jgi:hypothetical protein
LLEKITSSNAALFWSRLGATMRVEFLVPIMVWFQRMLWKRWFCTSSIYFTVP